MAMVYLLLLWSVVFVRALAGYDSRVQKGGAYSVKSPFFAALLLDRYSMMQRSKRKKCDQNKISLAGICLWSAVALVLLLAPILLLFFTAPIPPWTLESQKFFLYADTLGEKLFSITVLLLVCSVMGRLVFESLRVAQEIEQKWLKIFVWLVMALVSLALLACGAWLLWELVLCFA